MGFFRTSGGDAREKAQRRESLERVSDRAALKAVGMAALVAMEATELELTLQELLTRNDQLTGRKSDARQS